MNHHLVALILGTVFSGAFTAGNRTTAPEFVSDTNWIGEEFSTEEKARNWVQDHNIKNMNEVPCIFATQTCEYSQFGVGLWDGNNPTWWRAKRYMVKVPCRRGTPCSLGESGQNKCDIFLTRAGYPIAVCR